jgi:membrane protein implicated in regulation of membrane protease activity
MIKRLGSFAIVAAILAMACMGVAQAYVGPGAGISLLGALWALIAVIGSAILYVILWPWRRLMKRRKREKEARRAHGEHPTTDSKAQASKAHDGKAEE